jgi:D-sedoheptulose 7-phosphate isomerase
MLTDHYRRYSSRLQAVLEQQDWSSVAILGQELQQAWRQRKQVFFCGNGGSAANAIHLANDMMYGAAADGIGLRVHSLPANQAVVTCLANDVGYDRIFAHQLSVLAERGDLLIAMSGSGNSPNILAALETARELGLRSHAILGYSGGKALQMADNAIHFPIDDMQIAENCQQVVGHMLMQYLANEGAGEAGSGS